MVDQVGSLPTCSKAGAVVPAAPAAEAAATAPAASGHEGQDDEQDGHAHQRQKGQGRVAQVDVGARVVDAGNGFNDVVLVQGTRRS